MNHREIINREPANDGLPGPKQTLTYGQLKKLPPQEIQDRIDEQVVKIGTDGAGYIGNRLAPPLALLVLKRLHHDDFDKLGGGIRREEREKYESKPETYWRVKGTEEIEEHIHGWVKDKLKITDETVVSL
ncbi:MAG: hypothetical protein V1921_05340 [Candidatus Altiarchaeota archaeon]